MQLLPERKGMIHLNNKPHEECGVFGIYMNSTQDVAAQTYVALYALQHRGQESCGIVVNDDGVFSSYKDVGLVNDVFTSSHLENLALVEVLCSHIACCLLVSRCKCNTIVLHTKLFDVLLHYV